jgi:hypothetical protein
MKSKSVEAYSGQRGKEKRNLFGRFRLQAIEDIYRQKFFALFDHRCFKCGAKERKNKEFGKPPVLCIDHHIPMALGGHLVPGNLIALCRDCNNKKRDSPPEKFYSPSELTRLQPFLVQQHEIFVFAFNSAAWDDDREGYLVSLGVDRGVIQELLFNLDNSVFDVNENYVDPYLNIRGILERNKTEIQAFVDLANLSEPMNAAKKSAIVNFISAQENAGEEERKLLNRYIKSWGKPRDWEGFIRKCYWLANEFRSPEKRLLLYTAAENIVNADGKMSELEASALGEMKKTLLDSKSA